MSVCLCEKEREKVRERELNKKNIRRETEWSPFLVTYKLPVLLFVFLVIFLSDLLFLTIKIISKIIH